LHDLFLPWFAARATDGAALEHEYRYARFDRPVTIVA
jgi:hypothetical protein